MVIVGIINEDILNADQKYIAHQCNCLTKDSKGLAKLIFNKFPYANCYDNENKSLSRRDIPGTFKIMKSNNEDDPRIINIFGQWIPGKINSKYLLKYPKYQNINETNEIRLEWFKQAIKSLEDEVNSTVAIPNKIGCGLAGGDWSKYYQVLDQSKIKFIIYSNE